MFESLKTICEEINIIITMPNADALGNLYRNSIIKLSKLLPNKVFVVENFGRENYFSAIQNSKNDDW